MAVAAGSTLSGFLGKWGASLTGMVKGSSTAGGAAGGLVNLAKGAGAPEASRALAWASWGSGCALVGARGWPS